MSQSKKRPSEKSLMMQAALKQAVANELDKKSRLGQYAVFWENNRVLYKGSDATEISRK